MKTLQEYIEERLLINKNFKDNTYNFDKPVNMKKGDKIFYIRFFSDSNDTWSMGVYEIAKTTDYGKTIDCYTKDNRFFDLQKTDINGVFFTHEDYRSCELFIHDTYENIIIDEIINVQYNTKYMIPKDIFDIFGLHNPWNNIDIEIKREKMPNIVLDIIIEDLKK